MNRLSSVNGLVACFLLFLRNNATVNFPGGSVVENPPANAGDTGDPGSIPGSGRSRGGGNGNPLQYFLSGKSNGQRSLAGYSPWSCKESDMTEWLSMHTCMNFLHTFLCGICTLNFLLGMYQGMELVGHMVSLCLFVLFRLWYNTHKMYHLNHILVYSFILSIFT